MDSLIGCLCRHDQNPCPWWGFDSIAKDLKSGQNIILQKNEQINKFTTFIMFIRFFVLTLLNQGYKNIRPKFVSSFEM